jgi:hypothetical protein
MGITIGNGCGDVLLLGRGRGRGFPNSALEKTPKNVFPLIGSLFCTTNCSHVNRYLGNKCKA